MRRALITGITGQDGSYLAELLIAKGYQVHRSSGGASSFNTSRLDDVYQDPHEPDQQLVLHYGDLRLDRPGQPDPSDQAPRGAGSPPRRRPRLVGASRRHVRAAPDPADRRAGALGG